MVGDQEKEDKNTRRYAAQAWCNMRALLKRAAPGSGQTSRTLLPCCWRPPVLVHNAVDVAAGDAVAHLKQFEQGKTWCQITCGRAPTGPTQQARERQGRGPHGKQTAVH